MIYINILVTVLSFSPSILCQTATKIPSECKGDAKPSLPQRINFDCRTTENSINISIKVDCPKWNGPFLMIAGATCTSNWCIGNQEKTSIKVEALETNITIHNLFPYTNYSVNLYINQDETQPWISMNETRTVMTLPSVANRVPFLDVYQITENSLSLRWSPPYPSTGTINYFTVTFSTQWTRFIPDSKVVRARSSKCKIWTWMYCTTLHNLHSNIAYNISVFSHNLDVPQSSDAQSLIAITSLGYPEPPLNVEALWEKSLLKLQWQHPSKTYGALKGFNLILNDFAYEYDVKELNLSYIFNTTFQCTARNHYVNVSVKTVTSQDSSNAVFNSFHCPTFKPSYQSKPQLKNALNGTMEVYIPQIVDVEDISNLYIIFLTNYSVKDNCSNDKGETLLTYVDIKKGQLCLLLKKYNKLEYDGIENTTIEIDLTYATESSGYELGILIVNEYNDQEAYNWYKFEFNDGIKIGFIYSILLWSLLALVICLIIVAVFLRTTLYALWKKLMKRKPAHIQHGNNSVAFSSAQKVTVINVQ